MLLYRDMKPAIIKLQRELEGIVAAMDVTDDQDALRTLTDQYTRASVRLAIKQHEYWAASQDRGWPDAFIRRTLATPQRQPSLTI